MKDTLLEIFYIIIGILMYLVSFNVIRDTNNKTKIGTSLFWGILGSIFIFGHLIGGTIVGILLFVCGGLTATKQVKIGKFRAIDKKQAEKSSEILKNRIFLPSVIFAVVVVLIAKFTQLGGVLAIGISSVIALIITIFLTKAPIKTIADDANRMVQAVSTTCILPLLLSSLGTLFTEAGVGDVISNNIAVAIPKGNILVASIAYCLGMAIFTMVMGNAFAAFSVITVGIGVPFIFNQGGDIVISSTLALTAGYCGTLLTPMAANFNVLPVALLSIKDKNAIIKHQAPIATLLLIIHIGLMYYWAF